ncbi:hypothetical protein NHX12_031914 [Muraenolepis orangiensis]|uniref:Uncharacterized protein n=1 Tax=Muraenolepis orangiensis TaxID=630683 RepID=A0A9Q0IL27_9TELE|nr:hypothetical protein NHX12_031914 [Muraenolepis orangiensis]
MDSPHSHSTGLAPSLERQESSLSQSSTSSISDATAPASTRFQTFNQELTFLGEVGEEFTELESEDTDGSNVVFMGQVSEYEQPNLDDTLPVSPQTTPSGERVTTIVVVHRGQVLPELIAHFCNDELRDIKIQLLLPMELLRWGMMMEEM